MEHSGKARKKRRAEPSLPPDLEGDAKVEQLFTKEVWLGGHRYTLAVYKAEKTEWHWTAFLVLENKVLRYRTPPVNERQEAMKEAHFLANVREHVPEEYPEKYWLGWHEAKVLDSGFIV